MPGLTSLPLNLSEILEARKGPLRELEIWALLCQCAEALQDLLLKGDAFGGNVFRNMITPNALLVRDNGTIVLTENAQSPQGSLYIAPECDLNGQYIISDAAFEKMFVYSLGRTLQVASEFGLGENEILGISFDLDSLLQAMSDKNAAFRLSLMQILEACSLQASQNPDKLPHSLVLSKLYKSVLSGYHKSSFNDSNYGSEHSHEAVMMHKPGRARRPRPQVRHRHLRRRRRRGSTTSTSSTNSRSRSRSRSPDRGGDISQAMPSASQTVEQSAMDVGIAPVPPTTSASQLLNTSMTSTSSELSAIGTRQQAPPYSAASSVQGLLGLRQGSPAYQKYIKLKERQLRLRQAKSGQAPSALDDIRSRVMTPPLMSMELAENMSETHSMASLMSYTLGTYRPYLHADLGSEAALNFSNDTEASSTSQLSLLLAGVDYENVLRAQAVPVTVTQTFQDHPLQQQPQIPARDMGTSTAFREEFGASPIVAEKVQQEQVRASEAAVPTERARQPSASGTKVKDSEGPEFVHNMKKPAIHVAMPLQGDSLKNASLARLVTVVHLTGQKFEVVLDPSSTGRQLYDTVIPYLELDDFFFFGLTYISEGEYFFLDADAKLHKVAPEGWKEGPKGHQSFVAFNLSVRVKFYPESLSDFRHLSSQHLLYLQLRRDIVGQRILTDTDFLFKLAGLALQAEYGDHTNDRAAQESPENVSAATTDSPYFTAEHYVPTNILKQVGTTLVYTKVIRRHKACSGMAPEQAELEFIKLVQGLPEYGIHFYKLFRTKTQSQSPVWVGLSQHNFVVAEPTASAVRSITQAHQWNNILKISFNKRRFSLQPKLEAARGKPPKINFYTNSYRKGRYLLQFSTDQHRFQIHMKSRSTNQEIPAGTATENIPERAESEVRETMAQEEAPMSQEAVDPTQQPLSDDDDEEEENDVGRDEHLEPQVKRQVAEQPLRYRSPPPYQAPPMAQVLGGDQVFPGIASSPLHVPLADLHISEFDRGHLKTLLDMSSGTQGLECVSASNISGEKESTPPHAQLENLSTPGRRIFEVTLEKEAGHGVGITIVGGETTSSLDLGIFVKSVVAGGPAERDGRIQCGDRLIAIGGTSLEGKQHHEAVAMIRDSGPSVTFLVSQVRPPGTMKKRRSPSQEEEFQKKLRDSMLEYRSHGSFPDLEGDTREDFSTANIQDDSEILLRFDDFVHKHNSPSISGSDRECNSDEENYPLEPPPTPPSYPTLPLRPPPSMIDTATSTIPTREQQFSPNSEEQRVPTRQDLHWNALNAVSVSKTEAHRVPDETFNYIPQHVDLDPQEFLLNNGTLQALKLQEEEELANELMKESKDWQREEEDVPDYPTGQLTQEEQEDLQILGDLAALDADGSSSDSDFDSAIQKTIDAPVSKISANNKTVNTIAPVIFKEKEKQIDKLLSKDVIYEVILEKSSGEFGIIVANVPQHPGKSLADGGVFIKDILYGSPAHIGGILAPGDQILEIGGQSVAGKDSQGVQDMLSAAPNLTTVKIVRSLDKDAELAQQGIYPNEPEPDYQEYDSRDTKVAGDTHPDHAPVLESPLTALIPKAPTESTPPLGEDLQIVPPPPPLALDVSDSNTQSDVDSDVLDSSRSEVATSHKDTDTFAIHQPVPHAVAKANSTRPDKSSEANLKTATGKSAINTEGEEADNFSTTTTDTLPLEDSLEFDEKLDALKLELDRQLAKEEEEDFPLNLPSQSSDSSSAESVARSPKKLLESLDTKAQEVAGEDEHDDDDDVVVTMYGDEPAKDYLDSKKKIGGDGDVLDPYEPVLLSVAMERQKEGFGFTVAGGVNTGGCYIKQLVAEPAMSDGRLRPGDKILQVNGQDTTNLGHIETVTLLRKISDVAHLKILRFPSSMETQHRIITAQDPLPEAQAAVASARHFDKSKDLVKDDVDKSADQQVQGAPSVIIHPSIDRGRGLSDEPGKKLDSFDPTVDPLDPLEPAESTTSQQTGVFRVELSRPATSWAMLGIVLAERQPLEEKGETGSQPLIYVRRIKPGGLGSRDGGLQTGDVILQVNGTSFIGLTARQAVKHLREAGEKIIFTVSRPERREDWNDDAEGNDHEDAHDTDHYDDNAPGVDDGTDKLSQGRPASRVSDQYDPSRKGNPKSGVPVVLSDEWINELPLVRMAIERPTEHTRDILQGLADLVESGEPNDAFKRIRHLEEAGPCSAGQLPENKHRNRYRNVLPYDYNRVVLSGRGEGLDYINASYIEMPLTGFSGEEQESEKEPDDAEGTGSISNSKCLKYIACQGPMEGTVPDLWALLWQEKVHVVAMVTQTQEAGKLKCFPYWPQSKDQVISVDDGVLLVRLVRSYTLSELDVVQVLMEEPATQEQQEVIILQHTGWPDHGAPDTALPLLKLLQVMHLLESGSPPVIHCSAGVGRTGALIAIDVALACIEHGIRFNLYNIVSKLRSQRKGMVQTTDQYLFCYTACMEALLSMES